MCLASSYTLFVYLDRLLHTSSWPLSVGNSLATALLVPASSPASRGDQQNLTPHT